MTRRPSVIGQMMPKQAAPEPSRGIPAEKVARRDVVHTSVYIPTPAYEVLRQIAFTRGRKARIHDLMLEGIDAVLKRHGHPPLAELAKKTA